MIYIAMGANLPGKFGAPEVTLEKAKNALRSHGVHIVKSSRTWVTPPVPASDQPYYRNAVLQVKTDLDEKALLRLLHSVEAEFGRVRKEKNEPRVLDLDLIAYGDRINRMTDPVLPHPRMHERSFVLVPMREIAPDWRHPVLHKTPAELMAALEDSGSIKPAQEKVA